MVMVIGTEMEMGILRIVRIELELTLGDWGCFGRE